MKRTYFNLIYLLCIIVLVIFFLYSGWTYAERETETLNWKSGQFQLTGTAKLIGVSLLMSLPAYFVLRRKLRH